MSQPDRPEDVVRLEAVADKLCTLAEEHVPDDMQLVLAIRHNDLGTVAALHYAFMPQVIEHMLAHLRGLVESTGGSVHVVMNEERSDQ